MIEKMTRNIPLKKGPDDMMAFAAVAVSDPVVQPQLNVLALKFTSVAPAQMDLTLILPLDYLAHLVAKLEELRQQIEGSQTRQ